MTPLVLLPGMMCDARLFGPQIDALSHSRAIHIAPIQRHDTVEALASDVLSNAPPYFALAGLSMGGIVAMEMLRQAPGRIERVALMDTNPLAEADSIKANRSLLMAKVEQGHLQQVMRDEMKPNYLSDGPKRGAILDLCMAMATSLGPDAFLAQSMALQSRPDQQDTLRTSPQPTLILCGEEDSLCPVHRHELMANLMPNARLQIIKGAGHLPTLEQPAETTRALQDWLGD